MYIDLFICLFSPPAPDVLEDLDEALVPDPAELAEDLAFEYMVPMVSGK